MRQLLRFLVLGTALIVGAFAWAGDLGGTVIDGTTKKPAVGDEVVLLTLSQDGMIEGAHATTNHFGHFSLPVVDAHASHLVRVIHQGVAYHRMAEPDGNAFEVEVYDVADKLDGVSAVMDVQRFEATSDTLEVKQLITMRNDSKPPRTLMNDRPFEIQLPPEAQVRSGLVQVEEGQPLRQKPIAGDQKGQYYFVFPLRPGDTRFAVVYRMPYKGKAVIGPQLRNPLEQFVVMLPRSMRFDPRDQRVFHSMPDTTPDNVQGTGAVTPGQTLAFQISGTGTLEELQGRRQEAQQSKAAPANAPGGGLGPPIEAPDPLQPYRWQILGGLAGLTVIGLVYVARKTRIPSAEKDPVFVQSVGRVPAYQQSRRRMNRRQRRRARV